MFFPWQALLIKLQNYFSFYYRRDLRISLAVLVRNMGIFSICRFHVKSVIRSKAGGAVWVCCSKSSCPAKCWNLPWVYQLCKGRRKLLFMLFAGRHGWNSPTIGKLKKKIGNLSDNWTDLNICTLPSIACNFCNDQIWSWVGTTLPLRAAPH